MRVYLLAATHIAIFAVVTGAYAQEPSAAANLQGERAAEGAPQPAARSGELQEVVVTAQRRRENLQSVPLSVTAISAQALANAGISSTQDLSMVTPGLTMPETAGYAQPHIRGIGSSTNGPGLEQPVATYIDGVYIAAAPAALLTLNDVDHVEVLKGPQGTLFGRNATGGVIQIITKDPTPVASGSLSLGYGNYDDTVAQAYIAGPIVRDVRGDIALRYETQREGWGRNLDTGNPVGAMPHDFAGRTKWLYEPTEGTQVTLAADYEDRNSSRETFHLDFDYPTKQPLFYGLYGPFPQGGRYDTNTNLDEKFTMHGGGVSLQAKQRLGSASLKSITAYRDTTSTLLLDLDETPLSLTALTGKAGDAEFSQELQLLSGTDSKLTWTTGVFYLHMTDQWEPLDVNVPPASLTLRAVDQEHTDALAGYAQTTYQFLPRTDLTLGGRYSYESKHLSGLDSTFVSRRDVGDTPIPDPALGIPSSVEFNRFNYRAALDHKLTPQVMMYIAYTTGFKSGGYNLAVPSNAPYKPEDVRAVEAGLKSELFNQSVRVNGSGYYYTYKNIQVGRYINNNEQIYNGPRARIYGIDLDGEVLVSRGLRLSGGLSYNNARFTSFPDADYIAPCGGMTVPPNGVLSCSAKGNSLPYAPKISFDVAADYRVELSLGMLAANVTYSHTSKFYTGVDNVAFQPRYGLLNVSLGWMDSSGHWSAKVWGENIDDAYYATTINETNNSVGRVLGAPRTYGVKVGYSF